MAISRVGQTVDVTTPAWLYEMLPFIYIVAGLLAAINLSGALAIMSGALLVLVGAQVLRLRGRYRKAMKHPRRVSMRSHG